MMFALENPSSLTLRTSFMDSPKLIFSRDLDGVKEMHFRWEKYILMSLSHVLSAGIVQLTLIKRVIKFWLNFYAWTTKHHWLKFQAGSNKHKAIQLLNYKLASITEWLTCVPCVREVWSWRCCKWFARILPSQFAQAAVWQLTHYTLSIVWRV